MNTYKRLPQLLIIIVIISGCSSGPVDSGDSTLQSVQETPQKEVFDEDFHLVKSNESNIENPEPNKKVEFYKSQKYYIDHSFADLKIDKNIQFSEIFQVDIEEIKGQFIKSSIFKDNGVVIWNGYSGKIDSKLKLIFTDGYSRGTIIYDGNLYIIENINDPEVYLIVKTNVSEFPGYGTADSPDFLVPDSLSREKEINFQKNDSLSLKSIPELDVMVAYTSSAKSVFNNIEQDILVAIAEMNSSFSNSGISATINLVHTTEVSYTENSNTALNICRFTATSWSTPQRPECTPFSNIHGYMENIHTLRYQQGANLVVLVTLTGNLNGMGWHNAPLIGTEYAFSTVRADAMVAMKTLQHEIGHNAGAGHDLETNINPDFSHGHGFYNTSEEWRTIMTTIENFPYNPINHWSNPAVQYNGDPTGSSQRNNAKVWNDQAQSLSQVAAPYPYLQAHVDGPTQGTQQQYIEFEALTSGGHIPYDFQWQISYNGVSWQNVGSNASFYGHIPYSPDDFYVRVQVTDDENDVQISTFHQVFIN